MNIENDVFKGCVLEPDKLKKYGFKMSNKCYSYSKQILDGTFRVDVKVYEDGKVEGKLFDLSVNDEYTNHKVKDAVGEFVSKVRNAYIEFLIDIRKNCFKKEYFIFAQTNRITNMINAQYSDAPEFLWENPATAGVFRNPKNLKWYGIIMNVNKSKIAIGDEEVEVLNVKLPSERIAELLLKKGYYKAYHMNKTNWISIILDDTLTDREIMDNIKKSHEYTETSNEWIIPSNPKYFDVITYCNENDVITWKQSSNIAVGDMVYLYVGAPFSAIMYKCQVLKVNLPYDYEDDNLEMHQVMKLKILKRYNKDQYPFSLMKEYGVNAVRGPRKMTDRLSKYINK